MYLFVRYQFYFALKKIFVFTGLKFLKLEHPKFKREEMEEVVYAWEFFP